MAGGQAGLDKLERIKQLEHDLSVANEVIYGVIFFYFYVYHLDLSYQKWIYAYSASNNLLNLRLPFFAH